MSPPAPSHPDTDVTRDAAESGVVATAEDAVERGALNRLRAYRVVVLAWCLGGVLASILMPGSWRDRVVCWISVAMFLGSYALRDDRGPAARRVRRMLPVAVVQAVASVVTCAGLGVATPFAGLLVVGLVLYGLSAPPGDAKLVYAVLAWAYAALAFAVVIGLLPSTGLLSPSPLPRSAVVANALWIEATLATGFLVGRYARRDSKRLALRLEAAVRASAHREALLREAQAELARAARIGGPGTFSGVELGGFRLGNVIGRGGMGEVYAAARVTAGQGEPAEAAVKVLRRDVLAAPDVVRRFARETRIAASIDSPYVVRVLGVGGEEAPIPFLAMDRLHGEDLVALLRDRGRLGVDEALALVHHVGEGLRAAHEAGVVHRDLKPANLFLASRPMAESVWTILDFGVSKLLRDGGPTLTTSVIGTPHYMAPEQTVPGRAVDARADLYSLGVIAYRVLTGQMAFSRSDSGDVLHAVRNEMPVDPRALRPELAEDVGLWLRVAIAKRPEDRFQAAREMAAAFEDAVAERLAPRVRERARALLLHKPWATVRGDGVRVRAS
jgi:serine/threonine-protein kinase